MTKEQEHFLHALYSQYRGSPQQQSPFTKEWFWEQMEFKGPLAFYKVHFRPPLIITSYVDKETFNLFKDTGPTASFEYQEYITPVW